MYKIQTLNKLNNVLSRASLIIDEYNESLSNNNEYSHINILSDIQHLKDDLSDLEEALFFKELFLAIKTLNKENKNSISFNFYVQQYSAKHRSFIMKSISILKDIELVHINTKEDFFSQKFYEINIKSK